MMGNLLSVIVHAANIHDTKAGILPPDQHTKDTRLFKNFVLTLSIEVLFCLICRNSSTLMLIFRRKSNLTSVRSFLCVGLLSVFWHGWAIPDVLAKITRFSPRLKIPWLKSLIFTRLLKTLMNTASEINFPRDFTQAALLIAECMGEYYHTGDLVVYEHIENL